MSELGSPQDAYNFAYLDEQTKRMIRRAILKGIAVPGYQVPFASREMPMPYGWGTGGVQVTAACLVPEDRLKVIDQGADDTTNAVSIRRTHRNVAQFTTRRCPRQVQCRRAVLGIKETRRSTDGQWQSVLAGQHAGHRITTIFKSCRDSGDVHPFGRTR